MSPFRTARMLVVVALVGAASSLGIVPAAQAAPFAYFSNTYSDTVTVLDTATDTVVATVPVVQNPFGVALPVGQPVAYLLSAGNGVPAAPSGRVHKLDTATNTVTDTVDTGGGPSISIAVHPSLPRLYVANHGGSNTVSIIDTDTMTLLTTIGTYLWPTMVAVHPSGDRVYVVTQWGWVHVIDPTTDTIVRTIQVDGEGLAFGVAFSPGGDRAYFGHGCDGSLCPYGVGEVDVLDTATETIIERITVGEEPRGIVVNPAGTHVYVANHGGTNGGTVSVISTAANAVVDTITVGPQPWSVSVTPDGGKLYVVNNGDSTVSVIELGARGGGSGIPVGPTEARGAALSAVEVPPGCGDGVPAPGETCDDGNVLDGDGCDHDCTPTACGNGIVSAGEECDDGNVADGDDCSPSCERIGCGDGEITAGEECDDGNVSSADACSAECVSTPCGDGNVTPGEECDDGNTTAGDGCGPTCQVELIPGGGSPKTDCIVEWGVVNATPQRLDGKGHRSAKQTCRDGDPSCDQDGAVDGSCTFRINVCVRVFDTVPCSPESVDTIHATTEIQKPSATEAAISPAAAAIRAQLGAIQPLVVGPTHDTCSAAIDMVVPLKVSTGGFKKARRVLKTRVDFAPAKADTDTITLLCAP